MIEAALILWDIALPKLDGLTGQGGLLARVKAKMGSLILCVISLTYIGAINLCVLCVFVVRSTRYSLGASHFCKSTNWDFYGETLGQNPVLLPILSLNPSFWGVLPPNHPLGARRGH